MSQFSKTQYDTFSNNYDSINDLPITRVIVPNVERLVQPHVKAARVLELACGTGFFTKYLLDWGASSIVGVDVSQAMIDLAQANLQRHEQYDGKYRFMLADCSSPFTIEDTQEGATKEAKFDLVFAAWLLNYAPDLPTMTEMFKNISRHLRADGRFVTVLPHPEVDPTVCIDNINAMYEKGYDYRVEVRERLQNVNGYHVHLHFDTDPPVDFGNYYLSMKVHEQAARDGGMKGTLSWEDVTVPEDHDFLNRYMKEPIPKGSIDEWMMYPDCGILVVQKE